MSCPDTYVLRKDLESKEAPKGKCDFNAMERPLASVQDCITKGTVGTWSNDCACDWTGRQVGFRKEAA